MCERVGARFAHAADDGVKSVCEEYVSVRMADEGVDENKKLEYDYLIIATGSNYGGGPLAIKPGRRQGRQDWHARQKTFQRSAERMVMPSSHYKNHDDGKTTLIVGGGVVGVELAADIAALKSSSKGTTTTTSVVLRLPIKIDFWTHCRNPPRVRGKLVQEEESSRRARSKI